MGDAILGTAKLDIAALWTFILIADRLLAILFLLPALGTDQVPETLRYQTGVLIAFVASISVPRVPMPEELHNIVAMLAGEFALGAVISLLPTLALGGLSVSGQIISGVIGLSQASMIDRTLGEAVSIISKINLQIGTLIFLFLNGHHVVLKSITLNLGFVNNLTQDSVSKSVEILSESFTSSFELAIIISSPILIASLISQFILGLITKFVPQMNVFIVSLPLSVLMGLYMMEFTLEPFCNRVEKEFTQLEEKTGALLSLTASNP